MKLRLYYSPRFANKAFRVQPSYIRRKDGWKPAWIGVWFRFGWPYLNIGVKFT